MKRFVAVALALAFLGTAGSAFAQRIDTYVDDIGYVGDERTPTGPGTIPYNWENSPSADHPGDATGIPAVLAGEPGLILQVEFQHRYCVFTVVAGGFCQPSQMNGLLERQSERKFMVPGPGQFRAWYGTFADLDGNGWIDEGNAATDRVHTSLEQDCGDGPAGLGSVRDDDPNGVGNNQNNPAGGTLNTGVSLRCHRVDEWTPAAVPGTGIVAYVTPGNYGGGTDQINRWFNVWNPLTRPAADNPVESPDFSFNHVNYADGSPTGRYYSPTTNFDFVMLDNSLLQTTVVESISSPRLVADGARTHEASVASRVDVDLYISIDPVIEGAYQTTVKQTAIGAGCDITLPERGCRDTTDTFTEPVRIEFNKALAAAGTYLAQVYTPMERDPQDLPDRSLPHLYLDLLMENSGDISFVGTHLSTNGLIGWDMAAGSGQAHAWPQTSILGFFGIWEDDNGDGWIGEPELNEDACGTDPYQCGAVQNPHDYSSEEFIATCGGKDVPVAANADGVFLATVSSSTGSWGSGVYVLTDRYNYNNNQRDTLRDDGRVPFNPYDDLAADAAGQKNPGVPSGGDETGTAGQVESIVMTGDIQVHMICRSQSGFYDSFERLIFLDGTNRGYGITVSGGTGGNFEDKGVPADELAEDVDEYLPFALPSP